MKTDAFASPLRSWNPPAPVLRRKCACGSHTPGGSACPQCGASKSRLLQREADSEKKPPEPPPPGTQPLPPLIDDQRPKSDEEKSSAALGKFGEAFLETDIGGKITDKAVELAFGSTPQAVFSGVAIGATITGLALKHQELPFPIPAIPLNALSKKFPPGLTLELTWKGPVDRPTDGSVVLKFAPPKAEKGKPNYAAETAAMARDQEKFRAGMAYPPGSAEAQAQAAQEKAIRDFMLTRPGSVDVEAIIKKHKGLGSSSAGPFQLKPPSLLGPEAAGRTRPPLTLGEEFKLKLPDDLRKREDGPALQKKLAVGATDDPLEAEADRAAEVALAQSPGGVAGRAAALLQRRDTGGGVSAGVVPESVERTLSGSGRPLDTATRIDMESRFGHDFSHVRVHHDDAAARSAHDVGAHAYTAGAHIAFARGRFSPGSGDGRRLLAHELAHVVQQSAVPPAVSAQVDPHPNKVRQQSLRRVPDIAPSDAGSGAEPKQGEPGPGDQQPPAAGTQQAPAAPPAAQPVCDPKGFARADYLKQPGTSQKDFGFTNLVASNATFPAAKTVKTRGGVKFEPTMAALPHISSFFTAAGEFVEGETIVFGTNPGDCPSKRYPIKWVITPAGAGLIRQGEVEHCADFQLAFDLSLARYAAAVNGLAQSGKVFASEKAALKHLTKITGAAPANWPSVFFCLAKKTELRDTSNWHLPQFRKKFPDPVLCDVMTQIIGVGSMPQIGQHPSVDIIKGCGELQPAAPPGATGGKTSASEPAEQEVEAVG